MASTGIFELYPAWISCLAVPDITAGYDLKMVCWFASCRLALCQDGSWQPGFLSARVTVRPGGMAGLPRFHASTFSPFHDFTLSTPANYPPHIHRTSTLPAPKAQLQWIQGGCSAMVLWAQRWYVDACYTALNAIPAAGKGAGLKAPYRSCLSGGSRPAARG